MPFENLNIDLFSLINAPAQPGPWIILVARILAEWVVYFSALWMAASWIWSGQRFRTALLDAVAAIAVGLGINQLIGSLWYHPRPFALKLGNQFLPHGADASFPSDHGVLMFSLAFILLMNRFSRGWGLMFFVLSLGVAWSRVYLGVHFPFDMFGAFGVAFISVIITRGVSPWLRVHIYPVLLKLYEVILSGLRLPERVFPRSK